MARKVPATKSPKLKIVVSIECVYEVQDLSDIAQIQEELDRSLEGLRCYGDADATTRFEIIDG